MLVYDVTKPETFENLGPWLELVRRKCPEKALPGVVVANKIDLEPHVEEAELIRSLNLDYIVDNPWVVISISALKTINVDKVISWLIKHSR